MIKNRYKFLEFIKKLKLYLITVKANDILKDEIYARICKIDAKIWHSVIYLSQQMHIFWSTMEKDFFWQKINYILQRLNKNGYASY